MAPFGTVYSYPGNPRVSRIQVIADINGLELDVPGPDRFDFQADTKKPEFLAKFPLGKVPAFEGADGFCLAESAAIATYVAASGPKAAQLLGADAQTKAKIAEWTLFCEAEAFPHVYPWLILFLGFRPYDAAAHGAAAAGFQRALGKLEATVSDGRRYLVGGELTLADLMVAALLFHASGFLLDAEMRAAAPKSVEWLKGIAATPEFAKRFGEYKPCEKRVAGA